MWTTRFNGQCTIPTLVHNIVSSSALYLFPKRESVTYYTHIAEKRGINLFVKTKKPHWVILALSRLPLSLRDQSRKMGGFSTKKMMFQQLLTSVLLLHLLISSSSGEYRILMLFKTIFVCSLKLPSWFVMLQRNLFWNCDVILKDLHSKKDGHLVAMARLVLSISYRIKKILYKKCCWNLERCCCCYSGALVNSSENGVCISKRGRPYELEGKLPESADLEFRDLNMCGMFHEKTCCSASRMLSSSLALQNLATHGEASKDCLFWFELLECSICHPDVGVQSGPLRVCASFCDTVFEACSDAYFNTSDSTNQVK